MKCLIARALIALWVPTCAVIQTPQTGPALDSPECIKVLEAKAERDPDEMLCVGRKGDFCAYPIRMLAYHRVVNDHLGGFILVTYDPSGAVGRMFERHIDGKEIFFDAAATTSKMPAMKDRETGSIWSMVTGEALGGALKGRKLSPIPSIHMTWARWKALHPDSYVLKENPRHSLQYQLRRTPLTLASSTSVTDQAKPPDRRLPSGTLVLGISSSGQSRAHPLSVLDASDGVTVDVLSGRAVALFSDPACKAYAAYAPTVDGKALKFAAQSRNGVRVFLDAATGSVWNIDGACVEGTLKGKMLTSIDGGICRWYVWSTCYPSTDISRPRRAAAPIPFFGAR